MTYVTERVPILPLIPPFLIPQEEEIQSHTSIFLGFSVIQRFIFQFRQDSVSLVISFPRFPENLYSVI